MPRYIDADKLCEGRVSNDPVVIAAKCELTADVQEVKHGHWTMSDDGAAVCSSCKRKMNPYLYGYHYCAMCGAIMDGE